MKVRKNYAITNLKAPTIKKNKKKETRKQIRQQKYYSTVKGVAKLM